MKYVFRAAWILGVGLYASAAFVRFNWGDASIRAEDGQFILLLAGAGALVWRPWPVTPSP